MTLNQKLDGSIGKVKIVSLKVSIVEKVLYQEYQDVIPSRLDRSHITKCSLSKLEESGEPWTVEELTSCFTIDVITQ